MAFESAKSLAERFNIVWASQGFGGSGKTHFLFTAPDPIYYFKFDPAGDKGITSKKQFKKKDIQIANYANIMNLGKWRDLEDRVKAAKEALDTFREDFATMEKKGRTGGVDKEDALWEMLRLATNEEYSTEPKNYQECNIEMTGWINSAENAGLNFALLRGMKEDWGQTGVSGRTGKIQYGGLGTFSGRGCKLIPELVQVNIHHTLIESGEGCRCEDTSDENHFEARIMEKCRLGNALLLVGKTYRNADFLDLATALYPNADPSVWD